MVGPIAGAKVTDSAKIASPIGCCGFGSLVSTSVNAIGISTPPANPCKAAHRDHRRQIVGEGAGDRKRRKQRRARQHVAAEREHLLR